MTTPIDPIQSVRCEFRCHHEDEHKLIELLLAKDVPHFDLWRSQRYGLQANQLNLIEQVQGFVRYTCVSCELPYPKAIEVKQALHQQIALAECHLLALIPCEPDTHHA